MMRLEAVSLLDELGANSELASLMDILLEEPPVTWALHTALLEIAAERHLPIPDLSHLLPVDNLDLQAALAPCVE